MDFAILAIPSLIVVFIMKYKYDKAITLKELLVHFIAVLVAAGLSLSLTYMALYSKLGDVEILNGEVTQKYKHTEWCNSQSSSCKHYTLREKCTYGTDSKGKKTKSCTTYKDFDYPYENDWIVKSTVGSSEIKRVNRQGTQTPPRWAQIQIGEPASAEHSYHNYLFADEYSLFAARNFEEGYPEEYRKGIPDYPRVYDYYRSPHVVNSTKHSTAGYEEYLGNVLKKLGPDKQLNIVVVLYDYNDALFTDALLSKWRGGKKNDVIMMFGLDSTGIIQHFRSTSFAQGMKNEELHASLRVNALTEKMDLTMVQSQVKIISDKFNRLPNKEFEYMKYKMEPKKEIVVFISIILTVLSIVVGIYMKENDVL